MNDITRADLARGKKLKIGAAAAPVGFTLIPAGITLLLLLLAASSPPVAAVMLFVGIIATVLGFVTGIVISGVLLQKNSAWTNDMRDRIAANGIKAEQIEWFRKELKPSEKRALK